MRIASPQVQQVLSLPVWIAGSYMVREFSKHLIGLTANQEGKGVKVAQRDKRSWQLSCALGQALEVSYEVYAFDPSVRSAWLGSERGFFNGTSLFLAAHGNEEAAHELEIEPTEATRGWHVHTGLEAVKMNSRGFGRYTACNYEALVDCPVEMGPQRSAKAPHGHWCGTFVCRGVEHEFVVAGAPAEFDGERLLRDTQTVCEAIIGMWHGKSAQPPMQRYVFMLNAVADGYGGLEHKNSTALIAKRADLPRQGVAKASEGYNTLLGLISHEYFHTWNVKRLRPAEFLRYDFGAEQYTELLWFFEGFTSYYDDLMLRRSGLISHATYLGLVQKAINQVLQTPGRAVQSVAQASFDAWVKYYRVDENTPNITVSYYAKGALVALCTDLKLRSITSGQACLDDVMRALWSLGVANGRGEGGPISEADVLQALVRCSSSSARTEGQLTKLWRKHLVEVVHGTAELPVPELLAEYGIGWDTDAAPLAQTLGLRIGEGAALLVKNVFLGGAAHAAGLASGDEVLAVELGAAKSSQCWRITSMEELALYAGRAKRLGLLVSRDRRVMRVELNVPPPAKVVRLSVRDAALAAHWLG